MKNNESWHVDYDIDCGCPTIVSHSGELLAKVEQTFYQQESKRRAELMATSPELLAELDRSTDLLEDAARRLPKGSAIETCIRQQIEANNAIAKKARGE